MTAVALNYFTDFKLQLWLGKHNFNTNTFKLLLTNGAPSAAWTAISQATEITAEHGYPSAGISLTTSATASGFVIVSYTLTASGGTIGPFQYSIIYNSSVGDSNNLVGWLDYGSAITMQDTQTNLWDFPATLISPTWS